MEQKLLTCIEAAKVLRVTRKTIYRWLKDGKLPSKRYGRKVLIPAAALEVKA